MRGGIIEDDMVVGEEMEFNGFPAAGGSFVTAEDVLVLGYVQVVTAHDPGLGD